MKKKKILYLMHVDWCWIKQRPHFFAEGLSEQYQVTVCHKLGYGRKMLMSVPKPKNVILKKVFAFPFSRLSIVEQINKWIFSLVVKCLASQADIIWLTHPSMFDGLAETLAIDKIVIYDCMDDCLGFRNALVCPRKNTEIRDAEGSLINRANRIFVSSDHLRELIIQRYRRSDGLRVVNNGIEIPSQVDLISEHFKSAQVEYIRSISGCKILYFGTISDWFDFALLDGALNLSKNVHFILVGPREVAGPKHPRIHYLPAVEHRTVFKLMQVCDGLMMPFILNDLVKSVNPVKVYEYIFSGKPALVLSYGETLKFSDYVYLYSNPSEFTYFVEELASGRLREKISIDDSKRFLRNCSWKQRLNEIFNEIESVVDC